MPIPEATVANFHTLQAAADNGDLAVLECTETATGATANLVCAVAFDGEQYVMTPLARMLDGDPYEQFTPPTPTPDEEENT